MINLAIQTAEQTEGFAILEDEKVLAEVYMEEHERTSEALGKQINKVFKNLKVTPDDVDFLTLVTGPGSFTGLKVGAAYAKGFAFGGDIKIVPVASFEVLAEQVEQDGIVATCLFARNLRAYCIIYNKSDKSLNILQEPSVDTIDNLLKDYKSKDIIIAGSAVTEYSAELKELGFNNFAKENIMKPSSAGIIGFRKLESAVDAFEIQPYYLAEPGITLKKK